MIRTEYLRKVFNPEELKSAVSRATDRLACLDYDAIAVRGNSGTLFGGALSYETGKHLILVRKPGDSSHSMYPVEGLIAGDKGYLRYIIVDDFIASGATVSEIKKAVETNHSRGAELVAVYQYREGLLSTKDADPYIPSDIRRHKLGWW